MGAYMAYLDELRPSLTKEVPQGEKQTLWVSKTASERWKALSEEGRRPYEEKSAALKKEYEVQLEEFKVNGGATKKMTENESPKKKARKERSVTTPEKNEPVKGTGVRRKNTTPSKQDLMIDVAVLTEATKLGFEGSLKNLAGRADVVGSGKSSKELLDALKVSNGLVNPAKRALLGE